MLAAQRQYLTDRANTNYHLSDKQCYQGLAAIKNTDDAVSKIAAYFGEFRVC